MIEPEGAYFGQQEEEGNQSLPVEICNCFGKLKKPNRGLAFFVAKGRIKRPFSFVAKGRIELPTFGL
jgi:hypothetical protein